MSFWQSFQGLLGPQGFQGFQAKDLFDNERWKRVPRGPEWENPHTMRTPTNVNYIPRGAARPGASIATTKRRPGPPRHQINTALPARTTPLPNQGKAQAESVLPRLLRDAGDFWGPKVEPYLKDGRLMRETGDYWGPIVDDLRENMDIVDDTKKYWGNRWADLQRYLGRGL